MAYALAALTGLVSFACWAVVFRRMLAAVADTNTALAAGIAAPIGVTVFLAWRLGAPWYRYAVLGVVGVGLVFCVGVLVGERTSATGLGA
ncbi:hypothetical protein EFA46_004250 [Halarchaeum sp. CBA1220]|uniref:hypothetical protein n=1 Tax=Halarchaeum sp. CBA1220 TaxID=1853682 RepID=UPI000F3AA489|nr:hypothetical protein [Halarchaeum sp. CBA1220]QLC33444.1 hypothetical protein EFA46_004250 [Halarchaeum sp. CBA1220]